MQENGALQAAGLRPIRDSGNDLAPRLEGVRDRVENGVFEGEAGSCRLEVNWPRNTPERRAAPLCKPHMASGVTTCIGAARSATLTNRHLLMALCPNTAAAPGPISAPRGRWQTPHDEELGRARDVAQHKSE